MPRLPSFWRKRGIVVPEGDIVTELTEFPQMETGAPEPLILMDEHRLALAYYVNVVPPEPGGFYKTVQRRDADEVTLINFVKFDGYSQIRFGYPNDEALGGHRLWGRGLVAYAVCEVKDSSWPRELEKANRAHHRHSADLFDDMRHIIFTFHDSTLEVLFREGPYRSGCFSHEVHATTMAALLPQMQAFVNGV